MGERIVALRDRPDFLRVVATWAHAEFWQRLGHTFEQTEQLFTPRPGEHWLPRTFVLLSGDMPLGMASIVAHDLETRRDLTPWLAALVVDRQARGRGHSATLVHHVEAYARTNGVPSLWLYTPSAEGLYAKLGWRSVETREHFGRYVVVMQRDLRN